MTTPRSANPAMPFLRSRLAAAYALRGEIERAAAELAETEDWTAEIVFRASLA